MTLFQRISNKEIPGYFLYEDDLCFAILDISQVTKGHTLIIPKEPYPTFKDVPNELYSHLMMVAKLVANKIDKVYKPSGYNLINNNGEIAGQTIFHFHLHLIPRYKKDEFIFTHGKTNSSNIELKQICKELNEA